jgi:hypothetical protein
VEERALHGALGMMRPVAGAVGAESAMRRASSTIIAHAMTIATYRCEEKAA